MTAPFDESAAELYMQRLADAEMAGERQQVSFGPYTAIVVIGALQLATRHPTMTDGMRQQLGEVIDQFRPWFAGTLGETIIELGNYPERDQ